MLKGEALSFRYGEKYSWVLQNVSIGVSPGEIVGLSGPSGQGKTTLAKLLAGYLAPQTGSVMMDGQPLSQRDYCPVQLIFQHPELAINPRWRIGKALNEGYTPPQDILRALSIDEHWMNRWPHELSGGELQRIAVARALGPKTLYIIADETTAMLDAITQAQIWQVIQEHSRSRNIGVLVISHEMALLGRLCHRIVEGINRSQL